MKEVKGKPTWRKDLITYKIQPWIMFSFYWLVIIWRSGEGGLWSFENGRSRSRQWKNFGRRWKRGVRGSWKMDNFHGCFLLDGLCFCLYWYFMLYIYIWWRHSHIFFRVLLLYCIYYQPDGIVANANAKNHSLYITKNIQRPFHLASCIGFVKFLPRFLQKTDVSSFKCDTAS